ncbi:hypothetical protein MMC17_006431 [Xylographa soralifera]|nr:hypothetical protein [Xylographa soralifera]
MLNIFPPFTSLPLDPDGPPGNAWGLFGANDELGMLNLLTPAVVTAAAQEIKSGVRVSLDWPLDKPLHPSYGRAPFQHEIRRRGENGRPVNDDIISFNTQSSSQWDGFRHYGYLKEKRYFNGRTNEDIQGSRVLGVDSFWADNGGIIGRGVLLDYLDYAERNSIAVDPFTSYCIPVDHLKCLVDEQGITIYPGDILFLRTGYTAAYNALSILEREAIPQRPTANFIGVESTIDVLRWLWENKFSAVASDSQAFESSPVGGPEVNPDTVLHQWLLGGWGMPIGEQFDLERLAEHCKETGRYSFFLSSVPLKTIGQAFSNHTKQRTTKPRSRQPKKDEFGSRSRSLRPGAVDPTPLQPKIPTELLKLRILLGNSDLQGVLEAYPKLLKAKQLDSEDTVEICRLLHYGQRSNGKLMSPTAIAEHVKEAVDHYQRRRLPPDPDASLHLISYFKESNQYDEGIEFWHWIVRQDNNYLDLRTYGAALELLALYGQPLAYCEEVYSHGLKRFPESFNEYHLSPGAIVSQLDQPTRIPKTSMGLLQGIIKARLIHGDWRNAYLALDTALRLHPTQMPSYFFHTFLEERPINEAYQIFCLLCHSGSQIKPYDVTWVLNDLVDGQKPGTGEDIDLDIALANLNAIHLYGASGRLLSARHLNILLQSSLMLLPIFGSDNSTYWAESLMDPVALVRQLFSIFIAMGVSPEISTYNTVIAAAGRVRHEGILAWAVNALSNSGIASNEITFECLLNATARTAGAAQVESTWTSRDPRMALMPSTWAALARATSCAGNSDFLRNQMKIYNVRDQKSTMRQVHAELAKSRRPDFSEPPVSLASDLNLACESRVAEFTSALNAFQKLLGGSDFGNLKKHPAVKQSIWPTSDVVDELWQKKLYEELSIDPTALAALEAEVTVNSEPPETNQDISTVESSTGFRLDELRYRNWKGVNELLEHAELFESRMEQAVDKAIEEGKPSKQVRSTKGISMRGPRQQLLRTQLMDHLADINRMKANPLTETDWRDKILRLRRVET